jgi:CheY-like chemotaxis protein
MTANAMTEDREACMAAGMNEYLSKPIPRVQLEAVLRRASDRVHGEAGFVRAE